MKLKHSDFKKPHKIPETLDAIFAFALEYGPKLIGPVPVIIEESEGERFIEINESQYWYGYGETNGWGNSGYFLVFVTLKQLREFPIHELEIE